MNRIICLIVAIALAAAAFLVRPLICKRAPMSPVVVTRKIVVTEEGDTILIESKVGKLLEAENARLLKKLEDREGWVERLTNEIILLDGAVGIFRDSLRAAQVLDSCWLITSVRMSATGALTYTAAKEPDSTFVLKKPIQLRGRRFELHEHPVRVKFTQPHLPAVGIFARAHGRTGVDTLVLNLDLDAGLCVTYRAATYRLAWRQHVVGPEKSNGVIAEAEFTWWFL